MQSKLFFFSLIKTNTEQTQKILAHFVTFLNFTTVYFCMLLEFRLKKVLDIVGLCGQVVKVVSHD